MVKSSHGPPSAGLLAGKNFCRISVMAMHGEVCFHGQPRYKFILVQRERARSTACGTGLQHTRASNGVVHSARATPPKVLVSQAWFRYSTSTRLLLKTDRRLCPFQTVLILSLLSMQTAHHFRNSDKIMTLGLQYDNANLCHVAIPAVGP